MGKRTLEIIPCWGQNRHFGRVFIGGIINKKGTVVTLRVIRTSGHSGLDMETLCVVSGLSGWKSDRSKGKKVATGYVLSIAFYLSR